MSTRTRPLLFLVPALFAFARAEEHPGFHPSPGSQLNKTFVTTAEFSLDDLSATVDGNDISQYMGNMDVSLNSESTVAVSDEYVSLSEGRPSKLARTFETVEQKTDFSFSNDLMGSQEQSMPASSELEGEKVIFTWNDETSSYDVAFDGDKGDEKLLEGLFEDMDLRAFLPSKETKVGDDWNVDLRSLKAIAMPGGNLSLLPQDQEIDEEAMEMFSEVGSEFAEKFGDLLKGECSCSFKAMREEAGHKLAEIEIRLKIDTSTSIADLVTEIVDRIAEEAGENADEVSIDRADIKIKFDGEGLLLWDLGAGHARSFELNGECELGGDFAITGNDGGEDHAADFSLSLSGSFDQKVSIED
jgi:hypothetical protein